MKAMLVAYVTNFTIGYPYSLFSFNVISDDLTLPTQLNKPNLTSDMSLLTKLIQTTSQKNTTNGNQTVLNKYRLFCLALLRVLYSERSLGFSISRKEKIRITVKQCQTQLYI